MRDLGCHQIQGYLFGRPMSYERASELVTGTLAKLSA
jgi:EAL domain-containing protein (putative c-di-GMP-specific phosphodiesterase class I)